jgi:hypothetical protein
MRKTQTKKLLNPGTEETGNGLKDDACAKFFGGTDEGLKAVKRLSFSADSSMP